MAVKSYNRPCLMLALALSLALSLSGAAIAQSAPFSITALVKRGDPDGRGGKLLVCDGCQGEMALHGLNDAGDVAFLAAGGGGGTCPFGGLFVVSQGRPLAVADFCMSGPLSPVETLFVGSLNNNKQVVFEAVANINGQPTPAVFLWESGTLRKIAAAGDPTPAGSVFSNDGFGLPTLNDSGAIAFAGSAAPPQRGLEPDGVFTSLGGMLTKVAATGDPDPIGTFNFSYVPPQEAMINQAGDVLFYAGSSPEDISLREKLGLFVSNADGIRKVAVSEDTLPDGARIPPFNSPTGDINDRGDVAFRAPLEGSDVNSGVYLYSGGAINKIARVGDPIPGGGAFQGFFDLNHTQQLVIDPGVNDNGAVIFEAFTRPSRKAALFMGSPNAILRIARVGDRSPTGEVIGEVAQFAINRKGQVAFFAYNKNGNPIGILLATPNPPAVSAVKLKRKSGQLIVNGGPFIVGDSVIEVNGTPLTATEFPADFQTGDGSATRIVSADPGLAELIPSGATVQITVFNRMTNLRSAPFAFTRP